MVKRIKKLFHVYRSIPNVFVFRIGEQGKHAWFMLWFQKGRRISIHIHKVKFEVSWTK